MQICRIGQDKRRRVDFELFKQVGETFSDYTAYYDVDDPLALSKPKKEDIQKWKKEKEEVFSRTNKQFKFSKKVKAEIEKKMDELGFY